MENLRKNICCNCGNIKYLVDLKWYFYCENCLTGKNKIQHYIKYKMTTEQKVNFAINILYDIKDEWINNKYIEKSINSLQKYYE